MRKAAECGPGYRGRKRDAGLDEHEALAAQFREHGENPPPYLEIDPTWVERRAKIFEAGVYPDKGVTVTAEDLATMVANFDLPVPILIEHAESPLELGYLTEVAVEGQELFGTLSLTTEANNLIEKSGARSLSVGLTPDLRQIREVSIVRFPRVKSAQLFDDSMRFETPVEFGIDWRAKYEDAVRLRKHHDANQQVAKWVEGGLVTPAQAPFVSALLVEDSGVEFNGSLVPVRDLVAKMIGAQPKHSMFGEIVRSSGEDDSLSSMLPEEAAFYRKHFPDVSLKSIAEKRRLA